MKIKLIEVERLNENAVIPSYAHTTDTGFDLFTSEETVIKPNETKAIPTGLKFRLPAGYGVMIRPRSGNTLKGISGCKVGCHENVHAKARVQIGTIDEAYRGEVGILTTNYEKMPITIPRGTKLAQGVLEKIPKATFIEVDKIDNETERGDNGFGSTGINDNR